MNKQKAEYTHPIASVAEWHVMIDVSHRPEATGEYIAAGLAPDDFTNAAFGELYELCVHLHDLGRTVCTSTIQAEAFKRGNCEYLMTFWQALAGDDTQAQPVAVSVDTLRDLADDRRAWELAMGAAELARRTPLAVDILPFLTEGLDRLAKRRDLDTSLPIGRLVSDAYNEAEEAALDPKRVIGVPTGFSEIDRALGNLQRKDLVLIAARPSQGKSALAMQIGLNIALGRGNGGKPQRVYFLSLEMSAPQLAQRVAASEAQLDTLDVRRGNLSTAEWARFSDVVHRVYESPLMVAQDYEPRLSSVLARIKTAWAADRLAGPIGAVIVDYLQLIEVDNARKETRTQEIELIVNSLKELARQIDTPVIALSQLSRAVESRADKRPQLSDLRDGGGLEQTADVVMFVHREGYYHKDEAQFSARSNQTADIIVAKNRNGGTPTLKLGFIPAYTRFTTLELREPEPSTLPYKDDE